MNHYRKSVVCSLSLLLSPFAVAADDEPASSSWFYQAPEHRHWSASGAPLVHAFRSEPAFNHRDLFLDYSFRTGDAGDEHEIETELEWALSERLGVIFELPFVFEEDDEGFGDLAIVPRALLLKSERFLLAANLEIGFPTGDRDLGFGEEFSVAPSFSVWWDLGNWWTLSGQLGWERGFESGDEELFGSTALIHTFGQSRHTVHDHGQHQGEDEHLEPGLLSLVLEVSASLDLGSGTSDDVYAEGIAGFYYGLSEKTDVRIGYQFPLTSPREFDRGVTIGLVRHF